MSLKNKLLDINSDSFISTDQLNGTKILIADDSPVARKISRLVIEEFCDAEIAECGDGRECISIANEFEPDIVLTDYEMPGLNGIEVASEIRKFSADIYFIMITASYDNIDLKVKALKLGVNEFMAKPVESLELIIRLCNAAQLLKYRKLTREKKTNVQESEKTFSENKKNKSKNAYNTLITDPSSLLCKHSVRVAEYSRILAKEMGKNEEYQNLIYHSALLHDIGKIEIDKNNGIKEHTLIGFEMLKNSENKFFKMAAEMSLGHHERFDGSGFPNKLKGKEIPLSARIVAVADSFDNLTSSDDDKRRLYFKDAIECLMKENAGLFDPAILKALKRALEKFASRYITFNS